MTSKEAAWRKWMLAARRGDEASYKQLLNEVAHHIRRWAFHNLRKLGQPETDVEDIVQETLLALHLQRHTWKEDEPFSPWLSAIARYKLVDTLRRRTRRRWVPLDDFVDVLAAHEVRPALERQDIIKMADTLPEKQRAVVVSVFVNGSSTKETASRFDMTENAVRVTLHRALSKLAKRFGAVN